MKTSEKNPQAQPVASPPNPERRRFLRTLLFTGAALAAGCKSEKSNTNTARVFQSRPFPIGNASVSLKECNNAEQTATFEVSRLGNGLPDSMTLLVPGSFTVSGSQPVSGSISMHEIYVERISCGANPQSADVSISESAPVENAGNAQPLFADLPAIGAVIAFFGLVAFWITHRRGPEGREGTLLSPKRQQNHNHLITR